MRKAGTLGREVQCAPHVHRVRSHSAKVLRYLCCVTWRELQQAFEQVRGHFGPSEAKAQWRRWIEARTGKRYAEIALAGGEPATPEVLKAFDADLADLRSYRPVQQILGFAYFDDRKFHVNSNVLIPRPETEELVAEAARRAPQGARVLDLGTGSGCIPVALKLRRPDLQILGLDCSESALEVARQNGTEHSAAVTWLLGDLHQSPPEELKVDVVLSNPPYVTPEDPLEPEVRDFEPALALFAPPGDPLYFYRRILEWADRLEARQLGLECHRAHAEATAQLAREFGWDSTASVDQFGAPRWVWGLKTRA